MKEIGAWEWPATGKSMFNVFTQFITKPFLKNSFDVTWSCGKSFLQLRVIYISKMDAGSHSSLTLLWENAGTLLRKAV